MEAAFTGGSKGVASMPGGTRVGSGSAGSTRFEAELGALALLVFAGLPHPATTIARTMELETKTLDIAYIRR